MPNPRKESLRQNRALMRCQRRASCLALVVLLGVGSASAQAAAEYAGAISAVGSAATKAKPPKKQVLFRSLAKKGKFLHVVAQPDGSPAESNRQALEERAGEDAGKLLLRSEPKGAQVLIDGKLVGRTPLLLILAPGSYQVEMRGARMERGQQQLDLLPQESRKVILSLARRYPTRVYLR